MAFFDEEEHVDQRYELEDSGKFFFNRSQDDGDSGNENDEEHRHMAVVQESRPESISSSEMMGITTCSASSTHSHFTSISTTEEEEEQMSKACSNPNCSCTNCTCGPGCQCEVPNEASEHKQEQKERTLQPTQPGSSASAQTPHQRLLPVKPLKPPRPRPASSSSVQPRASNTSRQHTDSTALTDNVVVPDEAEFGTGRSPVKPTRLPMKPVARPSAPTHVEYPPEQGEFKDMSDMHGAAHPEEQEPDPVQPLLNRLHEQLRVTSRSLPPLALNVAKQHKDAVISMADLLIEDPLTLLPVINALHMRISKLEKEVFGAQDETAQDRQRAERSPAHAPGSPGLHIAGN